MSRCFLNAYFFFLAVLILVLIDGTCSQLNPGGNHVCRRTVYYNAYETRSDRRIGYDNYRTCCRKFWRICLSRCTRTRSKWVTYYKNVLVTRSRYAYECCAGWARTYRDCSAPICSPGCINGRCISPNNCQCNSGFQGSICQSDINECSIGKPCSQICNNLHGTYACSCKRGFQKSQAGPKSPQCSDINECSRSPCSCASNAAGCVSICVNTIGSFRCQCNSGFKLVGMKSCVDIDECKSSSMNSCQQTCKNTVGSYICTCKRGFLLKSDGFGCSDVNECKTLNGGCQQTCINQIGSYHCKCLTGFRMLPDQKRCMDVDECSSNIHSCDKLHGICTNTRGSYKCSCQVGYALQEDNMTCQDINECLNKTTNECAQNCHNTDGSYKCSCRKGFRLGLDGRSCQDIDECKEKTHKCQQICKNTISSYICKCRQGYKLKNDGYSCQALPCETMTAPTNGQMRCDGFVTDKACNFSCNQGFYLTGSQNRTCLPTSVWSGRITKCLPKPCPTIEPPKYGSVVLPCIEKFNSTCLLKCNRKFYMSGNNVARCIVQNGITKWEQGNTTCKVATACKPNPCQHNGRCKDTGFKRYSCDCSNTGYIGKHCEKGLVIRPKYSKLIVGEKSKLLYFDASPENEIKITPLVADGAALIDPSFVRITYPRRRAAFYITSQKVGLLKIKYRITGPSAAEFLSLPNDQVYSSFKYKARISDIGVDFYKGVCRPVKRMSCLNGQQVQVSAACLGKQGAGGFVSVVAGSERNNKLILPLSAVGLLESSAKAFDNEDVLSAKSELEKYLRYGKFQTCKKQETCSKTTIDADSVTSIFDNHLFAHAYFQEFSRLLPFWIRIGFIDLQTSFSSDNFRSSLLKGDRLNYEKSCRKMMATNSDLYSVYTPKITTKFQLGSVSKRHKDNANICYNINMCNKFVQVGSSKGILFSLSDVFHSIGITNFNASVKRFGIGRHMAKMCYLFGDSNHCIQPNSYWDISGSFKAKQLASEINFDGRMFTEFADINKFQIEKFPANQKFLLQGRTTVKMALEIYGEKILFTSSSKNSAVKIDVGGPDTTCSLCNNRGIHIKMPSAEASFDSKVTGINLDITPKTNISLHIPMQLKGGEINGILNKHHLSRKFRLFMRIRTLLSKIKVALGFQYLKVARLIDARFRPLHAIITSIYKSTKRSNKKYQGLYKELENLKKGCIDLEILLRGLIKSLAEDSSKKKAGSLIKVVLSRLKQIQLTKIQPQTEPINLSIQGQILSFEGKLCIHNLCFQNLNFTLYDLGDHVEGCNSCYHDLRYRKNAIMIKGVATSKDSMGERIEMIKGQKLVIYFNKTTNVVQGECDVFVRLRSGQHKGTVLFSDGRVYVKIQNVPVIGNIKMNVSNSLRIESSTWQMVSSNLKCSTSGTSEFAKSISAQMQIYFKDVSNETRVRVERAKANELSSYRRWQAKLTEVERLENLSKLADEKANYDNLMLQKNLGQLSKSQSILNSYIKSLSSTFIERNMDELCKLRKCEENCITLPHCEICQEPVHVKVKTLKCKMIKRTVRSLRTETFNTNCEVRKHIFIPIYTGTCRENPSMASYRQGLLRNSLVSVGAGIGSFFGPVGGLIGGLIGGFMSLFSSCDRSYKVVTKVRSLNVPCVKSRTRIKTTILESSACYHVDKTVKTGYGEPKDCNCIVDPCFAKVKSPSCLINNEKCHEARLKSLENTTQLPDPKFAKLYKQAQRYKQLVELQTIQVETSKQQQKQKLEAFKRAKNMLGHYKQNNEIAKQNHKDITDILRREICIAFYYNKSNNIDSLMKVGELTTELKERFVDNMKIVAKVFHIEQGETIEAPSIFQTRNVDTSIKMAGRKIIRDLLCPESKRQRRSTNDDETDQRNEMPFISWHQDASKTITVAEHACITLQKSLKYLKEINSKLYLQMVQAESISEQIADTRFEMEVVIEDEESNVESNNNSVSLLAKNKELVAAVSNSVNAEDNRNKPSEVIKQWLINSELYTKLNNLTICSGFIDCVQTAFKSIRELPRITDTSYEEINGHTNKLERLFDNLIAGKAMKFDDLRFIVYEIEQTVDQVLASDLHCSKAPNVSITPDEKQLNLVEGDVFKLSCNVTSSLPFETFWKINDTVKDGTTGNEMLINTTIYDAGMYACIARNAIGESTSDQIMLNVNTLPRFIEEPKDFKFIKPSAESVQPYFICNVSAVPRADIEWFFIPFGETEPVRLSAKSSILEIENATLSQAGLYYCRASNAFGTKQSSRARLDVLESQPASQSIILGFEIKSKKVSELNSLSFKEFINNNSLRPEINIQFTIKDSETGKLEFKIERNFPESKYKSKDEMFNIAMKSRQELSSGMSSIIGDVIKKNYTISTPGGNLLQVDKESFYSSFLGNICKEGYVNTEDGFTCHECQAGWYGGGQNKVLQCGIGTFQTKPGARQCEKCQDSFITEHRGATSSKECIKLETAKMDIVFILDSSRSTGYSNWNNIIRFIKYFVDNFYTENSTRLMLINYSDFIKIPIQFDQYPGKISLINRLLYHVYYIGGSSSPTKDALKLAHQALTGQKTANRKQIVAIFTDGQSSNHWYKSGFRMTREAALKLRSDDIHIISIGVGFTIDTRELHAIASYPKIQNTLKMNSFDGLINGFIGSFRQVYSMNCSSIRLDIGFFADPHNCTMGRTPWSVIKSAISKLPNSIQSKTKVSLLEYDRRNKFVEFKRNIDYDSCHGYRRIPYGRSGIKLMLQQAFNEDFTEMRGSIARVKILLAFTKLPVNPKDNNGIKRNYPEEKINFFNVLLEEEENYDAEDDDDDGNGEGSSKYLIRNDQINVLSKNIYSLVFDENCSKANK